MIQMDPSPQIFYSKAFLSSLLPCLCALTDCGELILWGWDPVYWVWNKTPQMLFCGFLSPSCTHLCIKQFCCFLFQIVLADCKMSDLKWFPGLTKINRRKMEMYFRMFCWSIKCYTPWHQKMLKSALKKQKNVTVADTILVICGCKSPPL